MSEDRTVRAPDGTLVTAGMVLAPFTLDQSLSLNAWQVAGFFHPYTCGNDSGHGLLMATVGAGWQCPDCDYTQNYALAWSADWSWRDRQGAPC